MDFEFTEELKAFQMTVRKFAEEELAESVEELDEKHEFPYEEVSKMADLGLLGLPIPEEYGGEDAGYLAYAIGVEEVSRISASLGITMAAHTTLGCMPIKVAGTEEQKKKWLPSLAQGKMLGCFGLTEPDAGSDAAGVKTRAVLEGGEWVINGTKCFITNSGTRISGLVNVAAVTGEKNGRKEISNIVVPHGTPGFEVAPAYRKMGWNSSDTHELSFQNCRVPEENILGKPGDGLKNFLITLDYGRIGVAAQSLGIAQACLEASVEYAKTRVQFGKPIGKYQGISFKCADMDMEVELSRTAVYKAAWLADQGRDFSREAAIAKLYASETAMRAASNAVQIHGGYGYIEDYNVCRFFRDAKILEIGEGTSEIQRIVLARRLGL
ncbi:MAG: acyl-CoA dehydrogenase family protein [Actinobacteria bacterium]|nr:acyl-CoA dehydrogenase family protein [Actinomycetota bacterium]